MMDKLKEIQAIIVENHDDLYDIALMKYDLGTRAVAFIEGVVVTLLLVWIF
jgi:hypothetical protein|tara:strand:- start:739 stop:891 length:153 start_codon:yes stop_codon:yes gene_type:complete